MPAIDGEYRYAVQLKRESPSHAPEVAYEELSLNGSKLFERQRGNWAVQPSISVPVSNTLMLGSIPGVREIAIAFRYLSTGVICYDFPSRVLLGPSANGQQAFSGFTESGENYIDAFKAITNNLHMLEKWKQVSQAIRTLNANVTDVSLNFPQETALVVKQKDGNVERTLSLGLESEGLRRFIAHLLALYQEPSKMVLVFEHPETGIHPGALQSLADQFKACPQNGRGQVLLTTHSPQLLDLFKPEQIRVVEIDKYITKIGPMAPDQLANVRDNLLRPGELLTVDLARVSPATVP